METHKNKAINTLKHSTYKSIVAVVDLSEYLYTKLNNIKFDYKKELSSMFDESDKLINTNESSSYSEYKFLEPIILWLGSLFGALDSDKRVNVEISNNSNNNYYISRLKLINPYELSNKYLPVIILGLLFMVYYFFT